MDFKSFRPLFSLIIPTPLKRYTLSRNLEFHELTTIIALESRKIQMLTRVTHLPLFFQEHAKHRASVATKQTVDPDFVKSRKVREEIDTLRKF